MQLPRKSPPPPLLSPDPPPPSTLLPSKAHLPGGLSRALRRKSDLPIFHSRPIFCVSGRPPPVPPTSSAFAQGISQYIDSNVLAYSFGDNCWSHMFNKPDPLTDAMQDRGRVCPAFCVYGDCILIFGGMVCLHWDVLCALAPAPVRVRACVPAGLTAPRPLPSLTHSGPARRVAEKARHAQLVGLALFVGCIVCGAWAVVGACGRQRRRRDSDIRI